MSYINKEDKVANDRKYYLGNREKFLIRSTEQRKKNPEATAKYMKEYYQENKNNPHQVLKRKEYAVAYRKEHPKYPNEYYVKNREKLIAHNKKRRNTDIQYRLAVTLRTRLGKALKGKTKKGSFVSDLGCSISELKFYLEGKFQDGMVWENYGQWHLDHILPLAFFDLTDREQFLKACHYTNLQPLWARENLIKGAKITKTLKSVIC